MKRCNFTLTLEDTKGKKVSFEEEMQEINLENNLLLSKSSNGEKVVALSLMKYKRDNSNHSRITYQSSLMIPQKQSSTFKSSKQSINKPSIKSAFINHHSPIYQTNIPYIITHQSSKQQSINHHSPISQIIQSKVLNQSIIQISIIQQQSNDEV